MKKPILIDIVFRVSIPTPNLRKLYAVLDDEERYYNMVVSKSQHGRVAVRLEVSQADTDYYATLLSEVEAADL